MSTAGALDAVPGRPAPPRAKRWIPILLLGVTLFRGILYLVLLPPWQHYDEPTHFEYVRLIALRHRIPEPGEYDLALRREIASSMEATDFWEDWGSPPFGYWDDEPPHIGASELAHPPLYYLAQSMPQVLLAHQSVEMQLYVARLGSVLLYVVVVASAYGTVTEGFPRRRWLPLVVATFIAFLPPLTDLLSGVNNDAGAAAVASAFLWAAVRLVRRGPSPERLGLAGILAVLCLLTKTTAGAVAIAVLAAVVLTQIRRPHRRWLWAALAFLIPITLLLLVSWDGQAAYWLSESEASAPNQTRVQAPLGTKALALAAGGRSHPRSVFQELSEQAARDLKGATVTVGAWIKAREGAEGFAALSLYDGNQDHRLATRVTGDWEFYAFTATLGVATPGLAVRVLLPERSDAASEVHVDGLLLVEGEMPIGELPRFDTVRGEQGGWGPYQFDNLLRNGSAEIAWPSLRPWAGAVGIYQKPATWILHSLMDWRRTGWVYVREFEVLLRSFWGTFGWNHLSLPDGWFYLLAATTIAAIIGLVVGLVRRCRSPQEVDRWQWRIWVLFGVALLAGWGSAILRIHPVFATRQVFWPAARYAVVAIVPTATLLCAGLAALLPRRWRPAAAWLGLLSLLMLEAVAMWNVILPYYYG